MKHIITFCLLILVMPGAGFAQTLDLKVCIVTHCNGDVVSNVELPSFYFPNDTISPVTGSDGCALYQSLPPGNYTITPFKDTDPLNGVTALDLVQTARHILGIQPLSSPYAMIAADANKSNSITTFDMVEERKLIQGIYTELPNNTSWRFVAGGFGFPNPDNPFQSSFPESIDLNGFQDTLITITFYGVKTGDTDCDAFPGFSPDDDDRSAVALTLPDVLLQAGTSIDLPLQFEGQGEYLALQTELNFDPEYVEIETVTPGTLPGLEASSFARPRAGVLSLVWFDATPQSIRDGEKLATIRVRALAPARLSEVVSVPATQVPPAIYSAGGGARDLQLKFADDRSTPDSGVSGVVLQPNPTKAGSYLSLFLSRPETVSLSLTDLSGKTVWTNQRYFDAGAQVIEIPATAFLQPGIYLWRLNTDRWQESGRMLKY
ncbi:MAG: T9SS type A sorting domain-containing protein [Lewinellaceae bacterium]|nr:T9SS type A sorting domain-containing protein [Lewinellaceae bacterium]